MATIDIGKIKPVFKGTYDNSTAYVLDDIVYYNGSSYVAKTSTTGNLPTDATKWNVLASGSGGIWDSTLSLGSAEQVVKVNSGGTALEYGSVEAILNIDGMTDGSGITIADSDKFAISDGGTEKYIEASQITSYVQSGISALDATSIADGSVSNTEFQYLNGVTSNIQTQIDTKASTAFAIAQAVALGQYYKYCYKNKGIIEWQSQAQEKH